MKHASSNSKRGTRTPQINAIVRAKADLETGNYAAARRRVESYCDTCKYNPALLGWFGNVAREMHDAHTAGRYLLFSDQEGPDVDECVQKYLSTVGNQPLRALVQIPRCARLESVEGYDEIVQSRLRRLGLDGAVSEAFLQSPPCPQRLVQSSPLWGIVFLLLLLLLFVGPCTIGAITIARWAMDS